MIDNIKQFLKKYNFRPNDLLGQNFLINEKVLDEIVNAADLNKNDQVMEIGAGIGNLTKRLADKSGYVLAIEKDERYFPILKDELGDSLQTHTKTPKSSANVQVVFADVVSFNFQDLLKPGYKVVANIPYYITGKIIEMLVTAKNKPSRIVLLIQKEVAQRITAKPGDLSILALSVQLYAKPKMVAVVPKEDFYPAPKVDSTILVLDILPQPQFEVDEKKFFKIIKAAFSGKRKQIHNTLENLIVNSKLGKNLSQNDLDQEMDKALTKSKVDPKSRPQELDLPAWHRLYINLEKYL